MIWIQNLVDAIVEDFGESTEVYPQEKETVKMYLRQYYGATEREAEEAWNDFIYR